MIRSLLFIPANHPGMMQNADIFSADAVIFDLEDGVILTEKDAAKDLLSSFLSHFDLHHTHIIIRINEIEDLDVIFHPCISSILLPKASVDKITQLEKKLISLEKKYKITHKMNIIALIESPESVLKALEIAKIDRVSGLLLGAEDLATHLGVSRTLVGHEIEFARNMVIYAAKSYQKDAIDTPYTNTVDYESLKQDTMHAKALGMNAKACIHPNQIEIVNTIFMPSKEEIDFAHKIMIAKEKADLEGLGAFSVDGKMIDQPIILRAKQILEKIKE
jgi:citrate lyase subunit beta / citryl-CoA lyase